ncbi:MAG: hypothetical protein JSW00_11705 [Thermoplasmata archaeon]|nr:MAG: hypothetical protein JSW00_11705 [Thermoplasmata archaeon]
MSRYEYWLEFVKKVDREIENLEKWLDVSKISKSIRWQHYKGRSVPFMRWRLYQKKDLRKYFFKGLADMILYSLRYDSLRMRMKYELIQRGWITNGRELHDPPVNILAEYLDDDTYPFTMLSINDAWSLYIAYVGHCLAFELIRPKLNITPKWSINRYPDTLLRRLFDSRYFFKRYDNYTFYQDGSLVKTGLRGYLIESNVAGRAIPAPPEYTISFILDNGILAEYHISTIGYLLDWCRENLVHFLYGFTIKNVEDQWQYRGFPPISRIVEGTLYRGYPQWGIQHRTAGCHGTNGFLISILRAVNIPVVYHRPNGVGHALPYFVSVKRYLSHGDDPYNAFVHCTPQYSGKELLINQTKYNSWFSDAVPYDERTKNVGRRVYELALEWLPDYLLAKHCSDMTAGRNHEESDVAKTFERWYTVSDLEAMDLWTRLEEKINSFGGCEYIP